MKRLNLTEEEKSQLKRIHKYTYNNSMRENRIKVVLLYDKNMGHQEIKEILLLDLQTIRRYINDFIQYRMDSIDFEDGRKSKSGNKKKLTAEQEEQVKRFVQEHLIEEAKEVQGYIKESFSIAYHINSVINLLHHLGFSCPVSPGYHTQVI